MLYISKETDIFFNLAFENYLINCSTDDILYLWQNSPSVIIGRFQNPYEECNLENIEKDHVNLVRRSSGGGAVYHDFGNECFTIIKNKDQFEIKDNFEKIVKALESLNIKASLTGRNDIVVDDKKVSGSAYEITKTRGCHHGTMLLNSNLQIFERYLNPSKRKLESHAVKSVRSRVTNLSITREQFEQAMIHAFDEKQEPIFTTKELLKTNDYLVKEYEHLKSKEWVFGSTPKFTEKITKIINNEEFTICLLVKDGIIKKVDVYTDSLDTHLPEIIKKEYLGVKFLSINPQS